MATFKPLYDAGQAVTITLASLASSASWTAGRQSDQFDNTTDLFDDVLVSFKFTTGTSPTVNKQINLYAVAWDAQANDYPDVITGAGDAAKTWTSANVLAAGAVLLKAMLVDATSDREYYCTGISLAAAFGGTLPQKVVFFVAHDTAVNANGTGGNFALDLQGVQYQSV